MNPPWPLTVNPYVQTSIFDLLYSSCVLNNAHELLFVLVSYAKFTWRILSVPSS